MTSGFIHTPVLLTETLEALQPRSGGRYIDATVGGGGHAEKLLHLSSPNGTLLGIDADPAALHAAGARLAPFGSRVSLVESYYDRLAEIVRDRNVGPADGVLFDLGVSSHQLDTAGRGFSFRQDAPLDMRLGPGAGITARDLVNESSQEELTRIFGEYGEERYAGRVARRVVEARRISGIETTGQLRTIVAAAKPHVGGERIDPATRVFQGLRIAVNDELNRLRRALPQALSVLGDGGRLAVISFHSLEDRIVKAFMRSEARGCICPPQIPVCVCGRVPTVRVLTARPLTAGTEEIARNPRARSAKLRVAEKLSA